MSTRRRLNTADMEAQVARIVNYFYDAYQATGRVEVEFTTPRTLTDSDMNSVINVYLFAKDDESRAFIPDGQEYLHLQFLDDEINPGVFGYRYQAHIKPRGTSENASPTSHIRVYLDELSDIEVS